ncbi:hypothetical protein C9374_011615 [Naegleria lovaniensis]|uniref:Protein kinase domain-containing protein n=1 Tax=Naegleria lovaniensis TaxID=51637 RepID=A0AA88G9L4_NAELO|nr:uncharacterized protein C9374_011615 [Naegleria lovaniensis]KAG2373950.1 hypothetical protein C9374_011615 [Naegleria lovaniensis]
MFGFGLYNDQLPNISVLQTLVQSQNFSNLKEFHLEFTCFHQDIVKVIAESPVLKLSGNLTVLSLGRLIIGLEDAHYFSQSEAFRNVKTLQLKECYLDSPRYQLSQGLSIQHYYSISKRNECIGGMGLIALEKNGLFSKNLTSLTISSSNLFAADLKQVIYFEQLKTLNLYRNTNIGSIGAQYLATSCENLKTLTCLNLSWCEIGDEGFMYLIRCPYWNHLEKLSISRNTIREPQTFQALGEDGVLLQQHLSSLDLTCNDIENDGVIALAQSCEKFQNLKHLYLSATSLNEPAAKSVLNGEKFSKLKTFSLHASYTRVKLLGSGGQGSVTLVKIQKQKKRSRAFSSFSTTTTTTTNTNINTAAATTTSTTTSTNTTSHRSSEEIYSQTTATATTTTTTFENDSQPQQQPREEEQIITIEKYRALKRIFCIGLDQLNLALREAQSVLQIGSHRNIVKCYNFFIERSEHVTNRGLEHVTTIENECVCIMYEYCEKGSLADVIRSKRTSNKIIPWNTVLDFFKQILCGIQFIHQNNICHRDMKPANVFLSSSTLDHTWVLKIGDFGFAKAVTETSQSMDTVLGTQAFVAPEIRQFHPYTTAVDIWGIGCILLEMLLPKTFDYSYEWAFNSGKTIVDLIKKRYPEEEIIDLIHFIMKMNPNERPNATQVSSYILKHIEHEEIHEQEMMTALQTLARNKNQEKEILILKTQIQSLQGQIHELQHIVEQQEEEIFYFNHPELIPTRSSSLVNAPSGSTTSSSSSSNSISTNPPTITDTFLKNIFNPTNKSSMYENSYNLKIIPFKDFKIDPSIPPVTGSLFMITFGIVKTREINNGEETKVALKTLLTRYKTDLDQIVKTLGLEFNSKISHPAIERIYGLTKNGKEYCIIGEPCIGGNLRQVLLNRNIGITFSMKVDYCYHISSALLYLYEQNRAIGALSLYHIALNEQLTLPKITTWHTSFELTPNDKRVGVIKSLKQLAGICWCILIRENTESIRNFFKSHDQFCPDIPQVIQKYLSPPVPTPQQELWIYEYIEIVNTCFSLSASLGKMNKEDASDHELLNGTFRKIVFRWGKLRDAISSNSSSSNNNNNNNNNSK